MVSVWKMTSDGREGEKGHSTIVMIDRIVPVYARGGRIRIHNDMTSSSPCMLLLLLLLLSLLLLLLLLLLPIYLQTIGFRYGNGK